MKLATIVSSILLFAALVAVLFVPQPAHAIGGGTPDGAAHPNVGLIGFDLDGPDGATPPFALCTSFVVSDSILVTAAHCIEVAPDASWVVTFAPGNPDNPVLVPGVYPPDFPFPFTVPVTYAEEAVMHPQFGDGHWRVNDVAILQFPEGTFADVTPVDLPSEGQLDALAAQGGLRGQDFTLVGYGGIPVSRTTEEKRIEGYRQVASAPFQALTPHSLVLQTTPEATHVGSLCAGDSGGPQFLGDSNLAVSLLGGVTNKNHLCATGGRFLQRLDTPAVREFLGQYVELP